MTKYHFEDRAFDDAHDAADAVADRMLKNRKAREAVPAATIGHNQPPSVIDLASEAATEAWRWLEPRPVLASDDEARDGKAHVDRLRAHFDAMERERDGLVRPLNEQVTAINARYKAVHNEDKKKPGSADKALAAVLARLTDYAARLEAARLRAAEEARQAAAAAEAAAREAEARERAAKEEAEQGVCDVPLAETTAEADAAFAAFQRAGHAVQRAERDTKVRLVGGFSGRALTFRDTEVLSVTDWRAAIEEMNLTDDIREAILKSARLYRKHFGELPAGIAQSFNRHL